MRHHDETGWNRQQNINDEQTHAQSRCQCAATIQPGRRLNKQPDAESLNQKKEAQEEGEQPSHYH
jgi:hypothetical protein